MKKTLKYICEISVLLVLTTISSFGQFYYSGGQQNQLYIDSQKVCIKFETIVNPNDQTIILDSIPEIVTILNDGLSIDGFVVCSLSNITGYSSLLNSVLSVDGISLVEPYYLTGFGSPYLVGDRFCVAFESTIDQSTIDSINARVPHSLGWVSVTAPYFMAIDIRNNFIRLSILKITYPRMNLLILQDVTYPTASGWGTLAMNSRL